MMYRSLLSAGLSIVRALPLRKTVVFVTLVLIFVNSIDAVADNQRLSWKQCLNQSSDFYATDEAVRIADNLLLYQREVGGWPKNTDMAIILAGQEKAELLKARKNADSTIDNGATYTQMRYLAKVYNATSLQRFADAFAKTVDYLLKAQYPNGGWPQFYPLKRKGSYSNHITFNDGAMVGVLTLLKDITDRKPDYRFVDEQKREKLRHAFRRGIECILKTQLVVKGIKTAWCQQYDSKTLKPAEARSYEKVSICASESAGIVRLLITIDSPNSKLIDAIQSAVVWLDRSRLTGIRIVRKPDDSSKGYDKIVVEDPDAPPVWARFYEIDTNKPIFCGRDGIVKYTLAEIEQERRTGYSWYGNGPEALLTKYYPAWQKKWVPDLNVLEQ